jgi:catechol 2,3-dioxygenase-like lactoylglutathione lyase family enzyme
MRTRSNGKALRLARAKGSSLVMRAWNAWGRAAHRLRFGLRIRGLDHVTIPCRDLRVAEDFYVGLLGGRVLMRIDEAFRRKVGRLADADSTSAASLRRGLHEGAGAGAIHTSVVFSDGPRLDLFVQPSGQPPLATGHPHHAFFVPPRELLGWKARLDAAGVPTFGPTRLGPPGQASLYFNDPFGNHLELVTHGFVPEIPIGAPDMSRLAYEWRGA